MKTLFQLDNPIIRFLSRVFDLAYLNLLCLMCCIPVITIGPSVTALYYCMLKISRDRDSSITKMFFHSFKTNFKQGCLMTLVVIGIGGFLVTDIVACNVLETNYLKYIKAVLIILLVLFFVMVSYVFPLLAQFDNTIRNTLKNAFIMGVSNVLPTCLIAGLNSIPVLLFVFNGELFLLTFPVWCFGGLSLIAMINSKQFVKIFDKYID